MLVFGLVVTQMLGKNALRGKTHLSFLLPRVVDPRQWSFQSSAAGSAAGFGGLGLRLSGWRCGGNGMRR